MDEIDMELPPLDTEPDRAMELKVGSSRPEGKALGGPTATGGGRGGGGAYPITCGCWC
jgi:hypothetical protein